MKINTILKMLVSRIRTYESYLSQIKKDLEAKEVSWEKRADLRELQNTTLIKLDETNGILKDIIGRLEDDETQS